MSIYLVCEGFLEALDYRVLNLIINTKLGKLFTLEPVGGDSGLGIRQKQLQNLHPSSRVYAIEDRNFLDAQQVEDKWIGNGRKFYWSRHEIENYLLDPRVVFAAFEEMRPTPKGQGASLPQTLTETTTLIEDVGRSQIEHYVGLLICRSELTKHSPGYPCHKPANTQYATQTEWIATLQERGTQFQSDCAQLAADPLFDASAIETRYQNELTQIMSSNFFDSGQFLLDMGGHELFSGLHQAVIDLGMSGLTKADFENYLIDALSAVYVPGFFAPHDDFARLADKLV